MILKTRLTLRLQKKTLPGAVPHGGIVGHKRSANEGVTLPYYCRVHTHAGVPRQNFQG